jgi:hypothetical protein
MKLKYISVFSLLLLSLLSVLPVIAQTEEKFEHYNEYDTFELVYGINWYAQTFTPHISHELTKVVLLGYREGNPEGNFIVSIRKTDGEGLPTGDDLVVKSMTAMDIPTEAEEIVIEFDTQIPLDADTKYSIVFRCPDGDVDNWLYFARSEVGTYLHGCYVDSGDSGVVWAKEEDYDFWFEEWGYEEVTLPRRKPAPSPPEEVMPWFPLTFYVITVLLFFGGLYLYAKREL